MLRITTKNRNPGKVELVLEGRLVSDWIGELEEECGRHRMDTKKVLLNLAGVTFVDHKGLAALRRFLSSDVSMVNCPPLIESLIHDDGDA